MAKKNTRMHMRSIDRKLLFSFALELSVKISDKVYLKKIYFSYYNFVTCT